MRTKSLVCASIIILWGMLSFACNNAPAPKKRQVMKIREIKPLDGYWILTDVIDSVLRHKKVVHYIVGKVQPSMILLRIEGDNLKAKGIWQEDEAIIQNTGGDSLGETRNKAYNLLFDARKEVIKINTPHKTYLYRRLTKKELSSYGGLTSIHDLDDYLSRLYIQNLMSGTYKAIDSQQEIQTFAIKPHGRVVGFKDFKHINIYTHFGTTWRFDSYDAITFEGGAKPLIQQKQPYESEEMYRKRSLKDYDDIRPSFTFEFRGDTLSLQRLQTSIEDPMHCNILGKQKYQFLKQKL